MKVKQVQMNYKVGEDVKAFIVAEAEKLDERKPGWFLDNLLRQCMNKQEQKANKEKKLTEPKEQWQAPSGLNTKSWLEFEEHRKAIKKPLTDLARTKAANSICNLSDAEQQETIDMSIQSRWTGLYPGKQQCNKRSFIDQSNDATQEALFGKSRNTIEGECHATVGQRAII